MTWKSWAENGLGGSLRVEQHYGDRSMLCFSERPPNLAAMFRDLVDRFGERPAIVDDRTITYRQLEQVVKSIAFALTGLGISHGDRVAIFLGNCWEFLACTIACNFCGAIVVPIGTRQRQAEMKFLLNDCGAKVLIFEAELTEAIPNRAALDTLTHMFVVRGEVPGARPFSELLSAPRQSLSLPTASEEDTAVILYTSGTTGQPKGAELTHLGILHSSLAFARSHGLTEHDRGLVAVPLSHVTGLVGVALSTMVAGGCVVLMHQAYKTPDFLALASREKITCSILVPTIYTLCVMHPKLSDYDLSSWRIGCFGGAPMPIATIELLAKHLPRLELINAYGATETTSPTTIMPREWWRDHMDSVGQVVPYGVVKVVDETGQAVTPGASGELWVSGPMVIPRYWKRPDANASEFSGGFWHSGDIGSIDSEGFVRIFDRKKDMINRGGFKIFSAEVENVISRIEGVLESAIIGHADPVLGERVHAVVVVRNNQPLSEAAIRDFCAERLSDYKVPDSVSIGYDPLPRNANGKIQKALLRNLKAD
jgi:acyl-CoA synthetase (AMP-forming)/AMP-acid ligase II